MAMAYKNNSKRKIINSKLTKKVILIIFFILIVLNILSTILSSSEKYLKFNFWQTFPNLKKVYLESQYVNKHPKGWIPDEVLNSYAGGEYIRGINPILIDSSTPPIGRYLIGLSEIIFNNANIASLIFSVLSLFLMYLIGKQIFQNNLIAVVPPFLLSFEPIFKNQLVYSPLLDIFQLVFLLGSFYYFNKALNSKKIILYFVVASLFLGLFISTKFFITGTTIVAAWVFILLFRKEWLKLKMLFLTLPLSIFILLLSYIRVLSFDYTINKFLGIQKYVFLYHKSQLILPLSIWPLLLLNKWYVWFGNIPIISDPQWLITWPLVTIISIIAILLYLLNKIPKNKNVEVLMTWFVFYVLFFSFGQISSRYFVILIPVLYIISLYGIVSLYKIYKK